MRTMSPSWLTAVVLCACAGCDRKPIAEVASQGECLPRDAAVGAVARVQTEGDAIVACFVTGGGEGFPEEGKRYPCLRFDSEATSFAAAPSFAYEAPPPAPPIGAMVDVTVDDDASRLLARIRKTSGTHLFDDPTDLWSLRWIGDRVLASARRCCGPGGAQELVDPSTGDTLPLGDPLFFFPVEGSTWLLADAGLADQEGDRGRIVDVARGTVLQIFSLPNASIGPEVSSTTATKLADGRFAVVFGNPAGVAFLDVARRTMSPPILFPICQ